MRGRLSVSRSPWVWTITCRRTDRWSCVIPMRPSPFSSRCVCAAHGIRAKAMAFDASLRFKKKERWTPVTLKRS